MAQEVQTTLSYQAELNLVEGIGYQERKISDKMQVTDKFTNSWDGTTNTIFVQQSWISPSSRTVNSVVGDVMYRVSGGNIIIPLAGAYLAEITPGQVGSTTSYYYTIALWVNGVSKFSVHINYAYHNKITTVVNLGKRDLVTLALKADSVTTNDTFGLRLIKL